MDSTTYLITVVAVVVVLGLILALIFSSRKKTSNLKKKFGAEYDSTVEAMGSKKSAQSELEQRQKRVDTLNIRPLNEGERARYNADWTLVQAKFVDEPGQAIKDADRLIMEVMQLRDYPVADFEQRAADLSVKYPDLVTNYRAARIIALRNELRQADTEEMRQAMIHYKSLFGELLKPEM
jgi:hypothetical protein